MKKYNKNDKIKSSVVVLGFFDGVHIGHKELIKCAHSKAHELSSRVLVYTFDSHPFEYLQKDMQVKYLITNDEKDKILDSLLVDGVFYESFEGIADLTVVTPTKACSKDLAYQLLSGNYVAS